VLSKEFTSEALGAIANHGAANLSSSGDTEPGMPPGIDSDEERHVAAVQLGSVLVSLLEVLTLSDVFVRPKRHHDRTLASPLMGSPCASAFVRNRQSLAALGAAALQNLLAILGRHPDQESMGPFAAAVVRLKRAYTLCHSTDLAKLLIL
jgi:hypothetical protein